MSIAAYISNTKTRLANAVGLPLLARKHGDLTDIEALKTAANGGLAVELLAAVLPTGAATEAKQDDVISDLSDLEDDVEATHAASVYKVYASGGALGSDADLVTDGGGMCRRIMVGTSGTLVLTKADDTDETIPANLVPSGVVFDVQAKTIKDTSTAEDILVLW
jgi:outer membrane lipoprotein-sorting protein